jgi:hypothetical protein
MVWTCPERWSAIAAEFPSYNVIGLAGGIRFRSRLYFGRREFAEAAVSGVDWSGSREKIRTPAPVIRSVKLIGRILHPHSH